MGWPQNVVLFFKKIELSIVVLAGCWSLVGVEVDVDEDESNNRIVIIYIYGVWEGMYWYFQSMFAYTKRCVVCLIV